MGPLQKAVQKSKLREDKDHSLVIFVVLVLAQYLHFVTIQHIEMLKKNGFVWIWSKILLFTGNKQTRKPENDEINKLSSLEEKYK